MPCFSSHRMQPTKLGGPELAAENLDMVRPKYYANVTNNMQI